MKLRDYPSADTRRKALESELSLSFSAISQVPFDEKQATGRNCENIIGAVSVPLGIAGPLAILHSPQQKHEYYIPLATTEGALVASVNRGCKAIFLSGGARVVSKKIGITRAPVFTVEHVFAAEKFIAWITVHYQEIKQKTEATSSHLRLLAITPYTTGRTVFLRFRFDTEDAMGMNMVTSAVAEAVTYIESETGYQCVALSGNLCVDKKPNYLNFIEGRGILVKADVTIPHTVVVQLLKTTPQRMLEVAQKKLLYGAILSGSIGANAQYANILAAVFLATGQDMAHIAECSIGITEIEQQGDDLYISVYLPDLVIGTVGGGTQLGTQQDCLSLLGLTGGDNGKNAIKLSEILAAAVLAGEISLLSALASNDLAHAHNTLGRGNK